MTGPLLISFDVDCSADHAFDVWTSRIGTWWPRDHTVSGDPEEIVLEGGPGGRIYERTSAGERHEWGEVTVWEPPRRLAYLWHLGRERGAATEVEPDGAGRILLPASQRAAAGIEKKAVLLGMGNKFELWSEQAHLAKIRQTIGEDDVTEHMADLRL